MKSVAWLEAEREIDAHLLAKNWKDTNLGPSDSWPLALKISLSVMLNSKFPMCLYWGQEFVFFYNEAFRASLGEQGRHPEILGAKGSDAWPELWADLSPLLHKVFEDGEATWSEDEHVPLFRDGINDDTYWTFSYSPIKDERGKISGVFCTCYETTDKVLRFRETKEKEDHLRFVINSAELGTWDLNSGTGKFRCNSRMKSWFHLPEQQREFSLEDAFNTIIPEDKVRVTEFIRHAMERDPRLKYDLVFSIFTGEPNQQRVLCAKGKAYFSEAGVGYRFMGTLEDITAEVQAQESLKRSEENFRKLIDNAPIAIAILQGKNYEVSVANERMLTLWDRPREQVINRPLFECLPEVKMQGLEELLEHTYATGEHVTSEHMPVQLRRNNVIGTYYINFVYEPIKDSDGNVTSIIALARDMTEQVMMQRRMDKRREETKRLMLKASIDAQEKEREVISNELHDNVNQLLASTKLMIEMVDCRTEESREAVGKCAEYIEQAMDEIRSISHGLHPAILRFVGLSQSIQDMIKRLNLSAKTVFSFQHTKYAEAYEVDKEIELSVFRIIQSQVTNILKHAEAVSARISLQTGTDFLELVITDDGKGFDMQNTKKGLGLLNVINRTELLNGTVTVVSAPQKGCKMRIKIPTRTTNIITSLTATG